jgi:predicted nucleic acid-binding Zn ribbon protein
MLFEQNNQRKIRAIWKVIVALVIMSMILLSFPAFFQ